MKIKPLQTSIVCRKRLIIPGVCELHTHTGQDNPISVSPLFLQVIFASRFFLMSTTQWMAVTQLGITLPGTRRGGAVTETSDYSAGVCTALTLPCTLNFLIPVICLQSCPRNLQEYRSRLLFSPKQDEPLSPMPRGRFMAARVPLSHLLAAVRLSPAAYLHLKLPTKT